MKALKIFLALLCTLTILPVSAEEVTPANLDMGNVTMQCIYEGGITVVYDGGTTIYLSDSASESDNANTSIPVSNKYLLGSTKYLKHELFANKSSGEKFKCPTHLQVASILNEEKDSEEENKSYSNYYFLTNSDSKVNKDTKMKYILFFSADRIAEVSSEATVNNTSITFNSVSYSSGTPSTDFSTKAIDLNKKLTEGDDKIVTLADIYGIGYASKAVTKQSGWWFFGDNKPETFQNSIEKMANATKIKEVKKLINEKVFISKDANSGVDCNYTTISDQAIGTKLFITANIYKNGSVLIEGNYGTTTGNDGDNRTVFANAITKAKSTTNQLINPKDSCPETIYVKFPSQEIEYGKTTPTVTYKNIRYETTTTEKSEYVKMQLLPEGESNTFDTGIDVCAEFLPTTTIVLKEIIAYLTILVPVAVVVMIIVDYVKVVKANADSFDDANKKQLTRIKTRLALIAFFLLLRPLINFVLNILYINGLIEVSNINCLFF